jgi:hypothetical protein
MEPLNQHDVQRVMQMCGKCAPIDEQVVRKFMREGQCPPCLEKAFETAPPCGRIWVEMQLCRSVRDWSREGEILKCECYLDRLRDCVNKNPEAAKIIRVPEKLTD